MAMKAYKSYKNVDLPWLKRVPEHWEVARNKNFLSEQKAIVGDNFANYSLLSLTLNGVIIRDVNNGKGKFPASFNTYKIVSPGNMVFCLFDIDETPRTVGLSTHYGMITNAYEVLGVHNITPQYLYYYYLQLDNRKALKPLYHGLRKTITIGTFLQTKLPVPPKEEQDQIVRYLDWQNSRLNKLINAKKKEIALLEEQKQALISQAVTKGLDPHAPLKDSGIDWIGQIPEHWEINRLKDVSTLKTGSTPKTQFTEYFNGDIPWFTPGDFSSNILNTAERTLTQKAKFDGAATIIPPNSILLICIGGTVGKVGLSPIECSCNQQITAFTNLKCDSKYLLYWLLGNKVHLKGTASYTTLPILNNQTVGNYPFIAPYEFTIQHEIANHLDKKCFTIDAAINNINKTISFLQEYRTRLVADVVTGQIDVRNIAIPNYETVPETIDQPETAEESAISTEDQ